ncbi:hypothetical protein HYS91_04435 [Candidatus Daviesbacteria bacterium]|nr:hypothetical protein [Candidatus Daviesbacteria bacterium]
MYKLTLDEKKLQNLKKQLYGSASTTSSIKSKLTFPVSKQSLSLRDKQSFPSDKQNFSASKANKDSLYSDFNYLKLDLLKIFILSFLALGLQALLYLSLARFSLFGQIWL